MALSSLILKHPHGKKLRDNNQILWDTKIKVKKCKFSALLELEEHLVETVSVFKRVLKVMNLQRKSIFVKISTAMYAHKIEIAKTVVISI